MVNSVLDERINCEKKEFLWRVFSFFLFVPAIVMLFYASHEAFILMCWVSYIIMLYEIFSRKIKGNILLRTVVSFVCFLGIYSFVYCRKIFGASGCVFLICISSFTDIGAYSFGKVLKGPKLCPRISPNKTWAGLYGGILFANIAFFCSSEMLLRFAPELYFLHSIDFWTIQATILASVIGDLLESLFKRKIEVKDMGSLFPGHGGILDRLDSSILASIVLAVISIFS